jgi:hypothetical protein
MPTTETKKSAMMITLIAIFEGGKCNGFDHLGGFTF